MNKDEFIKQIKNFVPEGTEYIIAEWIIKNPVKLIISKERRSKLGDFRYNYNKKKLNSISINGSLNKYSFLITLTHEFAHAEAFNNYGRKIKPHGIEWKNHYKELMSVYFEKEIFPEDIHQVLKSHMKNPKASSHSDLKLVKVLNKYDNYQDNNKMYLEDLNEGDIFATGNKIFTKGIKRRTRFICTENTTKRNYLVSALAEVSKIEDYVNKN